MKKDAWWDLLLGIYLICACNQMLLQNKRNCFVNTIGNFIWNPSFLTENVLILYCFKTCEVFG